MAPFRVLLLAAIALPIFAQSPCNGTPAYSPCELPFDLDAQESAAHADPYTTVELHAEFRSPRFHTYKLPAFWDGGQRLVIRFTPTEPGEWIYRLTSNIKRWDGQTGTFTAAPSDAFGFVQAANMHHWSWTEGLRPHLWMGDTLLPLASVDQAIFERIVDARAAQKFDHMRGLVLGPQATEHPDPVYFRRLDERVRYLNRKGIVVDLILGGSQNQLARVFPTWEQRRRYINYIVGRYAPFNITWQGLQDFETYEHGRELMKEIGGLLKQIDPYQHPRTSGSQATSAPLLDDGWMDFVAHHSGDDQLCAIERQLFPTPFVNLKFAGEDSGAGKSAPDDVDSDAFRHRLWNSTMDGSYPTYFNTGTVGAGTIPVDAKYVDAPGAKAMTAWYNLFDGTRHWELEPYFDVDGGRALALEGVEYIVYVEQAGPVEVQVEHHGYDVSWLNPITGDEVKDKKGYKGEHFTGEPPDRSHDWVLHISRESHKEGMLKSYKFESRRILVQVTETAEKVPFEIAAPVEAEISEVRPPSFAAKIKHATRATRSMMWLWTGEATVDGQGYRVVGTGEKGPLHFPPHTADNFPAVLDLRLYGMNANGKVYSVDKTFQLDK